MKRYFIRAAKYLVYFVVLLGVMITVMSLMNSKGTPVWEVYLSQRGFLLGSLVIVFSLLYPFFGFNKKTLTFNAANKTEDVERVMAMCGYKRIDNNDNNNMVFRGATTSKKIMTMWEDTITITTADELSVMSGPRKEVVKAYFRFNTFI